MLLGKQAFVTFREWSAKNAAWVFLGTTLAVWGIRLSELRAIGMWPDLKFFVFERIVEAFLFAGLFLRFRFVFAIFVFGELLVIYAVADEIFAGVGAVQLKTFLIAPLLFFLVVLVEGLRHLNREARVRFGDRP